MAIRSCVRRPYDHKCFVDDDHLENVLVTVLQNNQDRNIFVGVFIPYPSPCVYWTHSNRFAWPATTTITTHYSEIDCVDARDQRFWRPHGTNKECIPSRNYLPFRPFIFSRTSREPQIIYTIRDVKYFILERNHPGFMMKLLPRYLPPCWTTADDPVCFTLIHHIQIENELPGRRSTVRLHEFRKWSEEHIPHDPWTVDLRWGGDDHSRPVDTLNVTTGMVTIHGKFNYCIDT